MVSDAHFSKLHCPLCLLNSACVKFNRNETLQFFGASMILTVLFAFPGVGVEELLAVLIDDGEIAWEMEANGRREREGGNDGRRAIALFAWRSLFNGIGDSGDDLNVVELDEPDSPDVLAVVAETQHVMSRLFIVCPHRQDSPISLNRSDCGKGWLIEE